MSAIVIHRPSNPMVSCLFQGSGYSHEDGSPEHDLKAQVRLAFKNLNAVLAAAGCTFEGVVDVTLFVVDPESNLDAIWSILPEYWEKRLTLR